MAKTGRNDPCPCGSGKKFKKCCLINGGEARKIKESEAIDRELKIYALPKAAEPPARSSHKRESFSELKEKFELLLKQAEAEDAGAEPVFYEVEELFVAAQTAGEREELNEVFERFRALHPKLYEEDVVLYAKRLIRNDSASGRADRIERHFLEAAECADLDFDTFTTIMSRLAYNGELNALLRGMRLAWPAVEKSGAVMEWAVADFAASLLHYEICAHLAKLEGCAETEEELIAHLRDILHFDEEPARRNLSVLSGRITCTWERTDASRLPDNDRLIDLMHSFHLWLRNKEGISCAKARLAIHHIESYLRDRRAGELKLRPGMLESVMGRTSRIPEVKPPEHSLCPDHVTLEGYGVRLLHFMMPMPYDAAALFEALPSWLRFLESAEVIDNELREKTVRDLKPVALSLVKVLGQFEDGDRLQRAVAAAWAGCS